MTFCRRLEVEFVNYANTTQNVVKALKTRVYVISTPWNPPKSWRRVMRTATEKLALQIGPELNDEALSEELSRFPPKKRELYTAGERTPLDVKRHARLTGFVKCENVPYKTADKPRMIQFRDPVFLAHMLRAYKPFEHAFYHGRYLFNKHQKYTCAKGWNQLQRMELIKEMVSSLTDPYAVDLDGSAFDAHVCEGALKEEWRFYDEVWRGAGYKPATISKMREMGRAQLRNRVFCRTDDGIVRYEVRGNRMSGDLNTGCGNSVLQSMFIACSMKELKIPEKAWRMFVDGDDAILLVEAEHVPKLGRLPAIFAQFSQDVKMGKPVRVNMDSLEPINFCQCNPIKVDGVWRLVRSPYKVYNGYKMQNIWFRTREETQRFFATIAPAEMIFAQGVPIQEALFKLFHALSEDATPLDVIASRFWLRQCTKYRPSEIGGRITWETRESFEKAFGITPMAQIEIETEISSWTLEDFHLAFTMEAGKVGNRGRP